MIDVYTEVFIIIFFFFFLTIPIDKNKKSIFSPPRENHTRIRFPIPSHIARKGIFIPAYIERTPLF